jgi:hypothetical protein
MFGFLSAPVVMLSALDTESVEKLASDSQHDRWGVL